MLGIENNGVSAGLIERGGEFLSKQIQQSGQIIETALIRNQAFRQAAEFGQQLSQINPQSDEFPQAATALAAQYPLVMQSGLAKPIIEPMAKAYAGYQAQKRVSQEIQGRKDVAGLRSPGMGLPIYTGGANGLPQADFNQDPLSVSPVQRSGIAGILGNSANTLSGQADVLPPLPDGTNAGDSIPDAATGMKRQKRPLPAIEAEVAKEYNDALAAHQQPMFKPSQIRVEASRRKAIEDKEIDADAKANAPAADFHESAVVPGVLLTSRGTPFVKTDTGVAHPSSEFAAKRIQDSEEKFAYRKEQDAKKQQNAAEALARKAEEQAAAAKVKSLQADMSRVQAALAQVRKFEYSDKTEERAQFTQRQREAQVVRDALAAAEKVHYDALKRAPKNEDLPVIEAPSTEIIPAPNGKKYEVDHASRKVLREVQ